jgi:hypothetical protein
MPYKLGIGLLVRDTASGDQANCGFVVDVNTHMFYPIFYFYFKLHPEKEHLILSLDSFPPSVLKLRQTKQ